MGLVKMGIKSIFKLILTAEEWDNLPNNLTDEKAYDYLGDNSIYLYLDWKPRYDKIEVASFFSRRVRAVLNQELLVELDKCDIFKHPYDFDTLDMIMYFDEVISKLGGCLVEWNLFDDAYRIFVVRQENACELSKIKSDFWNFIYLRERYYI